MIRVVRLIDVKSPWFLGGGVVSAVVLFFLFPWLFPGEAYHYEVRASWDLLNPGELKVAGVVDIRRPCPGSVVTSWFEFVDKQPELAIRVRHIEPQMIGHATVPMSVATPGAQVAAMNFKPPEDATGVFWQISYNVEICPDEAKRGNQRVGYVRIPPK